MPRQFYLGDTEPYPFNVLGGRLACKLALFVLVEMAGRTGFQFAEEDAEADKLFVSFLSGHAVFRGRRSATLDYECKQLIQIVLCILNHRVVCVAG